MAAPHAARQHQPLRPGGAGGGSFPGMRTGTGIRWISQYIPMPDSPEMYVPTQRGSFALAAPVVNRGSFPVTIVGVEQAPGSPFTSAVQARYQTSVEYGTLRPGHLLRDVTLGPGQGIMIGMPLRIAYCADRGSYVGEDVFVVTERFFGFTHVVPMPFVDYGSPVITNAPGGRPGPAGTCCSGS